MLRHKRMAAILAACVCAALGVLGWMFHTTRVLREEAKQGFFEQYNRQQLLIAEQAARTIEETFSTFRRNLAIVASLFDDAEVDAPRCRAVRPSLEQIFRIVGDLPVIDLVIFDARGDVVGIVPDDPYTLGRNYAWREYFQWAREEHRADRAYLSPFMQMEGGRHRGAKALIVAVGIYGEHGRFKGIATFTLNFDQLARTHVLSIRLGETGYAWLTDAINETVLVGPGGRIASQTFSEAFGERWPRLRELLDAARGGSPGTGSYAFVDPADESRSVEKLVGYAPVRVEEGLWTLGVCTPVDEVEALMGSYLQRLEGFSEISIGAVFGAALLVCGLLLTWNRALKGEVEVRTRDLEHTSRRLGDTFEELLSARKAAAVGSLALGLAHEIRNPLSAIRVNMDFLQGKIPDDPRARECFEIVEGEIRRLNALLGDVLSYAKPVPASLAGVDLGRVARTVLTLLEARIAAAGVEAELRSPDGPVEALCDEGQIRQVLLNLALNAVDAMANARPRRLTILLDREGGLISLRVRDTGAGIPEEALPRIFDPFFTTKSAGFGLGLSITESLVARNGGSISVSSRSGEGTEFRVLLPAFDGPGAGG